MAIESHVAELKRRHQALEKEIEAALNRPGADQLELAEMKKRKLHLKDEISRIDGESIH